MAPCEKRASSTCETKLVATLPTPNAAKLQITTAVVVSGLFKTVLTRAIKPALQAPLNNAAAPVRRASPRECRKRERRSFIVCFLQSIGFEWRRGFESGLPREFEREVRRGCFHAHPEQFLP